MAQETLRNIKIKSLRLWSKNPRYSTDTVIKINEIGKDDFSFDGETIISDNYDDRYSEYFKRLLPNFDSMKATIDLLESIIRFGFDSSIDDMYVTKPEELNQYLATTSKSFSYIKNIFYVVEGNRRLMCLDLLQNNHSSRECLKDLILSKNISNEVEKEEKEILENIQECLNNYDSRTPITSFITCKEMDFNHYSSEKGIQELNKMLNAKHFGNRTGKLNWPRGLILRKIFGLIRLQLLKNPEIENKEIYTNLESLIGKKITSNDVNSALFVNRCIELWNEKYPNDKIAWSNTESGDFNQIDNNISNSDAEEINMTENTTGIYISALELAKNNIKILNQNFDIQGLNKILKFVTDTRAILENDGSYISCYFKTTNEKLETQKLNDVLILITGAVKKREVTTRSFAKNEVGEVGKNIRNVIYPDDNLNINDISKLSINQILNMDASNVSQSEEVVKILSNLSTSVENLNNNYELNGEFFKNLKEDINNNLIKKVIWYIWKAEYGRVVKNKDVTIVGNIPTLIFSSLYRSTYEFLLSMLTIKMSDDFLLKNINCGIPLDENGVDNDFEKIQLKVFDFISQNTLKNVFSIDDGSGNEKIVEDFTNEFNSNNPINRRKIICDFDSYLFMMLGIEDFTTKYSETKNFDFFMSKQVSDLDSHIYGTKNNGTTYLNTTFENSNKGVYLSPDDLEIIENVCIKNNFFNQLDSSKEVINLFKIINMMNSKNGDSNTLFRLINRLMHKPLSSLLSYESSNDYDDLNNLGRLTLMYRGY